MSKPSALILGGQPLTLLLARHLIEQNVVDFVRVADKHLCIPADNVWLTFVDATTKSVLSNAAKENKLDYLQANLALEPSRQKVYAAPEGSKPFDYVFDLIGEGLERAPEVVQIERSKASAACGRAAQAQGVKAYVRCSTSYVECKDNKSKALKEDDATAQPWCMTGLWACEADRALAAVEGLNLVIARPAAIYGPGLVNAWCGRLLIGEIYRFTGDEMQMLWSPELPYNTIHSEDACSALWALATWMAGTGREEGNKQAGNALSPCRPSLPHVRWLSIPATSSEYNSKEVESLCPRKDTVTAPVFNLVDEGHTTLGDVAKVQSKVFDVKVSFTNSLVNAFAKLNMNTVLEEANDHHLESWPEILEKSSPPIANPPLSPIVPAEELSKHTLHLDGDKIRKLVGWGPKHPRLSEEVIKSILSHWRQERGAWPNAPPKKA